MKIFVKFAVEFCVLLFPILSAYALRIHGITERLSYSLAEQIPESSPRYFQKLLSPPGLWGSALLSVMAGALLLGGGLWVFHWYVAIVLFAASFFLILVMNYFIPSEKTPHYIGVILKNLRRLQEKQQDDEEERQALSELIEKLTILKNTKGLFDEKVGY